jgi:hypothetical protein
MPLPLWSVVAHPEMKTILMLPSSIVRRKPASLKPMIKLSIFWMSDTRFWNFTSGRAPDVIGAVAEVF